VEPVVPRYEFRAWGNQLNDVFSAIAANSRLIESRARVETYLVSRKDVGSNPKIRDGVLDVKVLLGVVEGCEQWQPTVIMTFPLGADEVREVLVRWLALKDVELERDAYTQPQLVDEVVAPRKDVAAIEIAKIRHAYEVNGCIAEVADVTIAGATLQTAAVESTDLDLLLAACRMAELEGRDNINYPKEIRRVLGW
jgi:hypothetical protein